MTVGELGRSIQRIELKIDSQLTDHEQRIRRMEAWMYALPAGVLTAVAAIIIAVSK